jgi:hypothetical protein
MEKSDIKRVDEFGEKLKDLLSQIGESEVGIEITVSKLRAAPTGVPK